MADLQTKQQQKYLVSPTTEVEERWKKIQISEKVSQINALKLQIEDYHKVVIEKLEVQIIMLQKEVEHLRGQQIVDIEVQPTKED